MKKYVQAASGTSIIRNLCSGQDFLDKILDMFWDDPESFGFTDVSEADYNYGIYIEYAAIKGNDLVALDTDGQMYVYKNAAKYPGLIDYSIPLDGYEDEDEFLKDHPEIEFEDFDMIIGKPYGKEGIEYLMS